MLQGQSLKYCRTLDCIFHLSYLDIFTGMDSDNTTTFNSTFNSTEATCSNVNETWLVFPITYLLLYILGITCSSIVFGVNRALKSALKSARNSTLNTRGRSPESASKSTRNTSESIRNRRECRLESASNSNENARNSRESSSFEKLMDSFRVLKQLARKLVSGDNPVSQALIVVALVCNLIYMALAFQRAYRPETRCFSSLAEVPDLAVEVVIAPLLLIFFVIRLLASDNLVLFWLKIHTIVDVVTLPNVFISISLGQDWLDTKSLRFVWLTQLADVLHFLPFKRSQNTIEPVAIMVRLLALWLGATGLIHLLESTGDPWRDFDNHQSNTFLEYAYFIMVTMSTVGYGDYFAMTDIGRAFMTFFIIAGIAFFAFSLPNLIDLVVDYYHRTQWSKFDTTRVPRHVLVCGHITSTTVSDFLKDFLHKDRGDSKTHVLFMHTERPNEDLRVILRSYYTRVQYVVGSVLKAKDLAKAKIEECAAVFILAEKHCESPEREDQENLLRLVSIKNTLSTIPVTIQVLLSASKNKVKYIPHTSNDTVICLTELKLGLLAQSCLCPGISTLVSNFFYTSEGLHKVGAGTWQELYGKGISQEVYITHFSKAFDDKSFYVAARICYEELGLILLAVEDKKSGELYISPSPDAHPDLRLRAADPENPDTVMLGYLIGEDQDHVSQVSLYGTDMRSTISQGIPLISRKKTVQPKVRRRSSFYFKNATSPLTSLSRKVLHGELHLTDSQSMEKCFVNDESHCDVLLCVFADKSSSALYLRKFLEPLRRITIAEDDLMHVTIVANEKFLEKEWSCICQFPKLTVLPGCPLELNTLRHAGVQSCRVCVILTASKQGEELEEPAMKDKEAILCSLMIHNHHKQEGSAVKPPLILTDLIEESNVQFLDTEDEDAEDERIYIAQPFACGEAFAASLFDSITSSSFHSPGTLLLVEQLVSVAYHEHCPTRSTINLVPLEKVPSFDTLRTFKELYTHMLTQNKTPVAISRLLNPKPCSPREGTVARSNCKERYIVTAPPPNTYLNSSDHILVLEECFATDNRSLQ